MKKGYFLFVLIAVHHNYGSSFISLKDLYRLILS